MYYTIYQIKDKVTGKVYTGRHKTNNLNDGYMGSGTVISRIAQRRPATLEKTITHILSSEQEMIQKESEIVNEQYVADPMTYNLTLGGHGGWEHINNNKSYYIAKRNETVSNWSDEYKKEVSLKKSNRGKKNPMYGSNRAGNKNPMYGKKHSDETKKKISEAKKGSVLTEEHKEKISLSGKERWSDVKLRESRSKQYKKLGIRPPSSKGKKWWNNGVEQIRSCDIPNGDNWKRGRLTTSKKA